MDRKKHLAVGDVVLLVDPSNQKGKWPLGHMKEVFSRDRWSRQNSSCVVGRKRVHPADNETLPEDFEMESEQVAICSQGEGHDTITATFLKHLAPFGMQIPARD